MGNKPLKVGLVVPHIFMQDEILPRVIFSPAQLALELANGLGGHGIDVTLFTPGPVTTTVRNITADLKNFREELRLRGDNFLDLLRKHPLTFISLARQAQAELISNVYARANNGEFDLVHIYTNEEDIGLHFAGLCRKPVVFTHHDPFSFLVKYRAVMPRYKHLPWISMSLAQRQAMPKGTNWVGNIYHGLDPNRFKPVESPRNDYVAFVGRLIEPKGAHLAIAAVEQYNAMHPGKPLTLKLAGKHYASHAKDTFWHSIEPKINGTTVQYVGYIDNDKDKNEFIGNASALLVPSLFDEPFGMVMIEALACGTPVIGLDSGAIPEVITDPSTGTVVQKGKTDDVTVSRLAAALGNTDQFDRKKCRKVFEARFDIKRMCQEHTEVYRSLITE